MKTIQKIIRRTFYLTGVAAVMFFYLHKTAGYGTGNYSESYETVRRCNFEVKNGAGEWVCISWSKN